MKYSTKHFFKTIGIFIGANALAILLGSVLRQAGYFEIGTVTQFSIAIFGGWGTGRYYVLNS